MMCFWFQQRRTIISLGILAVCLWLSPTAQAQQLFEWTSGDSGVWSNAANWSGGTSPTEGDTTFLRFGHSGTNPYTATNDFGFFELNAMIFTSDATSNPLVVNGGTLRFTGSDVARLQKSSTLSSFLSPPAAAVRVESNIVIAATQGLLVFNASGFDGNALGSQNELHLAGRVSGTRLSHTGLFDLRMTGGTPTGGKLFELRSDSSRSLILEGPAFFNLETFRVGFQTSTPQAANAVIRGGAEVVASGQLQVGMLANSSGFSNWRSTGSLQVTGAGTTYTQAGAAFVGFQGNGSVSVTDSAQAFFGQASFGIENGSTGTFSANSGATASFMDTVAVGTNAGSTGSFLVSNANVSGAMSAASNLVIGNQGSGTLDISSGGTLSVGSSINTGANDNELILGFLSGGQGVGTVSGLASNLNATNLVVGASGTGNLTVQSGATASIAGITTVGISSSGVGSLQVSGAGTEFTTNQLQVGVNSTNNSTLSVSDGARLNASGPVFVGALSGSSGSITVDGSGSNLSAASLSIGGNALLNGGSASFSVTNGGMAQASVRAIVFEQGVLAVDGQSQVQIGLVGGQQGAVNVNLGGQLAGTGLIDGDVRVTAGGTLLPGLNSVGTMNIEGSLFLQSSTPQLRSFYALDLSNAGLASNLLGGSSVSAIHDRVSLVNGGNILFDNAQVLLTELTGFDVSFDPTQSYSWSLMEINGIGDISLLNSTTLSFNGSSTIQAAVSNNLGSLSFGIGNAGGSNQFLALSYSAVPEPSSVGMCVLMAAAGLMRRRRSMW